MKTIIVSLSLVIISINVFLTSAKFHPPTTHQDMEDLGDLLAHVNRNLDQNVYEPVVHGHSHLGQNVGSDMSSTSQRPQEHVEQAYGTQHMYSGTTVTRPADMSSTSQRPQEHVEQAYGTQHMYSGTTVTGPADMSSTSQRPQEHVEQAYGTQHMYSGTTVTRPADLTTHNDLVIPEEIQNASIEEGFLEPEVLLGETLHATTSMATATGPADKKQKKVKKKKVYTCKECSEAFKRHENYRTHLTNTRHMPEVFKLQCPRCDMKLMNNAGLKLHLQKYHGLTVEGDFVCNECFQQYSSINGLRKHQRDDHEIFRATHQCPECEKRFEKLFSLRLHRGKVHSKDLAQHTCRYCGASYRERTTLTSHIRKLHKEEHAKDLAEWRAQKKYRLQKYAVDYYHKIRKPKAMAKLQEKHAQAVRDEDDEQSLFNDEDKDFLLDVEIEDGLLNSHQGESYPASPLSTNLPASPFTCDTFTTFTNSIDDGEWMMEEENVASQHTPGASAAFTTPEFDTPQDHLPPPYPNPPPPYPTGLNVVPLPSNGSNKNKKSTTKKSNTKKKGSNHDWTNIRYGEKKFKCKVAGCLKAYTSEESLNAHILKIHGIQMANHSFYCDQCNKGFSNRHGYLSHQGSHKTASVACPVCNKSFVSRRRVIEHLRKQHNLKNATEAKRAGYKF